MQITEGTISSWILQAWLRTDDDMYKQIKAKQLAHLESAADTTATNALTPAYKW